MIFPCFLIEVSSLVLINALQDSDIQNYKTEMETSVAGAYSAIREITEKQYSHIQLCGRLEYARVSSAKNKTENEMDVCEKENQRSVRELVIFQTLGNPFSTFADPYFSSHEKPVEDCFSKTLNSLRESLNDAEAEARASTIHKCLYYDGHRPSCVDNISDKAAMKKRVDCFFMKIALEKITNVISLLNGLKEGNVMDSCLEKSFEEIVKAYEDPLDKIRICKRKMLESLSLSPTQCISFATVEQERQKMKTCIHYGLKPLDQFEKKILENTKKCREEQKM